MLVDDVTIPISALQNFLHTLQGMWAVVQIGSTGTELAWMGALSNFTSGWSSACSGLQRFTLSLLPALATERWRRNTWHAPKFCS